MKCNTTKPVVQRLLRGERGSAGVYCNSDIRRVSCTVGHAGTCSQPKNEGNQWDSSVAGSLIRRLVSCFCSRQLMKGELCLSEPHLTEELILHNPQRLQYSACYNSSPLLPLSLFVSLSNVWDEQL